MAAAERRVQQTSSWTAAKPRRLPDQPAEQLNRARGAPEQAAVSSPGPAVSEATVQAEVSPPRGAGAPPGLTAAVKAAATVPAASGNAQQQAAAGGREGKSKKARQAMAQRERREAQALAPIPTPAADDNISRSSSQPAAADSMAQSSSRRRRGARSRSRSSGGVGAAGGSSISAAAPAAGPAEALSKPRSDAASSSQPAASDGALRLPAVEESSSSTTPTTLEAGAAPVAAVDGMQQGPTGPTGRRSRSGSRNGGQHGGQDAAIVRRMPKLFPNPTEQLEKRPASSCQPLPVQGSEAPAAGKVEAAGSRAGPASVPASLQRAAASSSPSSPAAADAVQGMPAPAAVAPPAAEAAPVVTQGQAAAANYLCQPASMPANQPPPAALAPPPAAPPAPTPTPQSCQRDLTGQCMQQVSSAAEPAGPSKWVPGGGDSALSLAAAAVWHGAADADEAAAAAAAAGRTPPRSVPSSSVDFDENSSSRATSPQGSCLESEGSSSGQSWQPELWNPSQYGMYYHFSHPGMVFQWQDPGGPPLPSLQSVPASPHQPMAVADAASYRPLRPSAPGSFGPSMSMPAPGGSASTATGSFYGVMPPQPGGAAHMPQALALHHPNAHLRRSGSTSSTSSHSGGSSDGAGMITMPAYPAGGHPQWQGNGMCGWADPYSPGQPYTPGHLPGPRPPFVQRSYSAGRAQWVRQQQPAEPMLDMQWQHNRRRGSGSWLPEGTQQHLHQMDSAAVAGAAAAASPYTAPYTPPPQRSGSRPYYAPGATATAARGYNGVASAPSSIMNSPVMPANPQHPARPPASVPPPPLLSVPPLDLQVPESADDCPDLERFLQAATPQVVPPTNGAQDLRLADLWRWYEEPSTLGCEVPTVGGPRGPSTAYYLPYLSSVQLFVPASSSDAAAVAASALTAAAAGQPLPPAAAQLLSYPNGLDSWPERMRPLVQWGEGDNMRDRVPLHCRLLDLCGKAGDRHPLLATRIADLHPFSWFAVAWYPLYCVPEAPLTARFLTFHTLASLWETATEAVEKHRQQQQDLAAAAAAEAQRQRLQESGGEQAAAQEAAAAGDAAPPAGDAQAGGGLAGDAEAAVSPVRGMTSRPSYKSMLSMGLPPAEAPSVAGSTPTKHTATPTAISSFPGSPTCSDAGTRSTLADSRPHSVDGGGLKCSRLAVQSGSGSGADSSSGGQYACGSGCGSMLGSASDLAGSAAASLSATSSASVTPASPAASEAGDTAEALPVPVAGLEWYATGREENWMDTLVAAQLPPGATPALGSLLVDGGRVIGTWRGMAVVSRSYPVAKGGPLGWEIQQEEMAQCAERLACGTGLVALRPCAARDGRGGVAWERLARLPRAALGVSCPDYDFFCSRSSACY